MRGGRERHMSQTSLITQKIIALKNEEQGDAFAALFFEIDEELKSQDVFDISAYRKMISILEDRAYYLPKRLLKQLSEVVCQNLFNIVDATSVFRSVFFLSNFSQPGQAIRCFHLLYEDRPALRWALPMGINYVNLGSLNTTNTALAKRLIQSLLDSEDADVQEETSLYVEKMQQWVQQVQ